MNKIIHLMTGIKNELKELVRGSVEETLNKLLDEEADQYHPTGKTDTDRGYAGRSLQAAL